MQKPSLKTTTQTKTMKMLAQNLIKFIENPYLKSTCETKKLNVGSLVRLECKIQEGDKERTQMCEGLIIAKQNKGLNQTVTIRRKVDGIGVEQIFFVNSPKILCITQIQQSKVRRAKLFFTRNLSPKGVRLKLKRLI